VTIPANQASVIFDIAAVDDAFLDETQTVVVTASADGYVSAFDSLDVTADDNWTNLIDQNDTNSDGRVVPLDVLIVINELNQRKFTDALGKLPPSRPSNANFYDVNRDGFCTANDALRLINFLNSSQTEGESFDGSPFFSPPPLIRASSVASPSMRMEEKPEAPAALKFLSQPTTEPEPRHANPPDITHSTEFEELLELLAQWNASPSEG
jgi:hypothetical protein